MGAEDRPAVARRDGREPGRAAEVAVDLDDLATLLGDVLTAEGVPATAEASLQLVDADEIAALNAEHMGSAGPTDVLSFPLDGADGPDDAASAGPSADRDWIVGDVVVCPEVAAAQAAVHIKDEDLARL
ncbi:MAG TPA: rRNA maturation RNase YbeY, partial [Microthrixaceae bacterium]|nr:rRNA maturation RNase YbeY [Microthrixaceae bacterium]